MKIICATHHLMSDGYPRKRAQTRRRLVRAGMAVLAQRGPDGATVGEVAAAAGVAPGTFYNHFPTLGDLVDTVTDELGTGVEIGLVRLDALEHDPAGRVAVGTLQLLGAADDDPVFASAFVTLVNTLPPFRARVRRLVDQAIADGVAAGRFAVEPGPAATDAVLGAALQSMRSRLGGDADRSSSGEVVRLVLRVLGIPGPEADRVLDRALGVLAPAGG
jgi:AcrR family transcriptional regulator